MAKRFVLRGVALAMLAAVFTSSSASAVLIPAPGSTVRMAKIPVPGKPLKVFDISWVDVPSAHYYLADRSNGSIDIVDINTNQVTGQIGGFVGFTGKNDTSGPDGVVVTFSNKELWAGDGDSTVKVIDLSTKTIAATISTGGKNRADEMAYDPKDNLILVANNADDPPFGTLISVSTRKVLKKLPFEDAEGAEQPVYDAATGLFFMSIPATKASPGGAMAVIDPVAMTVVNMFALPNCGPNGAALGPGNQLLAGCGNRGRSVIIDKTNGSILAQFDNVGGSDEVWYNPGDQRYYLASSASQNLGIIDSSTLTMVANIQSGVGAHSVAADLTSNHIFVPIAAPDPACPNGCIAVYSSVNVDNMGLSRAF